MSIRKMVGIVIVFCISLICLSLIFNLVFYFLAEGTGGENNPFSENFMKLPLFLIGYGESPSISAYLQLVLCILGLTMVNFLNAYLTVELFRSRKVVIKPKLVKDAQKNRFLALVHVVNKGKQIYNVSLMLQAYRENQDNTVLEIGRKEYARKFIPPKKTARFEHQIEISDFLYNFFRDHYYSPGKTKLQVVLEYIDHDSGSQLMAKEFTVDDFYPLEAENHPETRNPKEKLALSEDFKQFISCNDKVLDLSKTIKISENGDDRAITISQGDPEKEQLIKVHLDFSEKENIKPPVFLMALLKNVPGEDWSNFLAMDYKLVFDLGASEAITVLQLEIKSDYAGILTKIVDVKLNTSPEFQQQVIRLQDFETDPVVWATISEICFTCFSNDMKQAQGEFRIKDLKLIA
jgi:hypothetical protein